jgi:hydrogenase expression/formation protein HypD
MVIGTAPYEFIAHRYAKPIVISGFEPLDILQSLWMLVRQLEEGRCEVENQYQRIVAAAAMPGADGGRDGLRAAEFFEWRGLGSIDHSGVRIRSRYARFDAERRFAVRNVVIADPKACQCGEVLKGAIKPWECKVFGRACTPETPLGALMVSSEGACAAAYSYGGVEIARCGSRASGDAVRA